MKLTMGKEAYVTLLGKRGGLCCEVQTLSVGAPPQRVDSYVLRQPRWTSPCRMGWSWGFGQTQTRQRVMMRGRVGQRRHRVKVQKRALT